MPGNNEQDGETIDDHEAWLLAAAWGSYIRDGDPGACLYGFGAGGSAPQDPDHRNACLAHVKEVLMPLVRGRMADGTEPGDTDRNDLRDLTRLRRWLASWSDADLATAGDTTGRAES